MLSSIKIYVLKIGIYMKKISNKKLIKSFLFIALILLLEHFSIQIGFLGIVIFIIPILFVTINFDLNTKESFVLAIIMFLVSFTTPISSALYIGFVSVPLAIYFHHSFRIREQNSKSVLNGIILSILGFCFLLVILGLIYGRDIFELLRQSIREVSLNEEIINMVTKSSGISREEVVSEITKIFITTIPSNIAIILSLYVFSMHRLMYTILKMMKINVMKYSKFSEFRLPRSMPMGTILILGLSWLVSDVLKIASPDLITNVIIIFFSVFSIQGLALISYLLKKVRIKGVFQIPIFVIALVFLQLYGLGFIGWLDVMFDIRKLFSKFGNNKLK